MPKLTNLKIEKLKGRGRHGDGAGLWLNVTQTSQKSWVYRWTRAGHTSEMGLGPYPVVTLAEARQLAFECKKLVHAGKDPKSIREPKASISFGQAADLYLDTMSAEWTNPKSRHQWQLSLTKHCAAIRSQPVSKIGTNDVLRVLSPIWTKTPETASRVRGRIERVLDFAKTSGWREGENPARWRGHLENALPGRKKQPQKHFDAMPYAELPRFMNILSDRTALSARALELTILTCARTNEILKSTWSEYDLEESNWVVAPNRMKAKREHRVPLSAKAVSILNILNKTQTGEFVFPGRELSQSLSEMSMLMLLRRMNIQNTTVHGFRSSFRDWCFEQTSYPREVAEMALSHKVGSDVELAYRRSDALQQRRQLMNDWADFCYSQTNKPEI